MIPLSIVVGAGLVAQAEPVPASDDQAQDQAVARRAIATISNLLAADGCSYPVTIRGVDYAPDASSEQALAAQVPAGQTVTARVNFQLTGGTGEVICGFGTTRQLPEISVQIREIIPDEG